MFKNLTKFQKRVMLFLTIAFVISFVLIGVLLAALKIMEFRLNNIGNTMEEMAVQHIITDVEVNEDIPLNSAITVTDDLTVNIDMFIQTEIPFTAMIPVSEEMLVPIRMGVKDYIALDTLIWVKDQITILVDDTIPLDQKMKMTIFGKDRGPSVPIKSKIPLNQSLLVDFEEPLPVRSTIPIDMLIIDTLPIGIEMSIPVDVMVPVKIPIKQTAKISFNGPMPVDAMIPISMNIPVDIPLEETSLAKYFRKLAGGLKGLTSTDLEDVMAGDKED